MHIEFVIPDNRGGSYNQGADNRGGSYDQGADNLGYTVL